MNPANYNVNIQRALNISDYDCAERRAELTWLAVQGRTRRTIVEVGSYKGCTARAIADNTAGMVYVVDTFAGSVGEVEIAREIAAHEPNWLYHTCMSNLADLKNVIFLKMDSLMAASIKSSSVFDMIFLDASHDYDSVKNDILAWRPLLAPGGLLCGHDRTWDGVSKAIDELLPGHKVGVGAIWYWGEACAF